MFILLHSNEGKLHILRPLTAAFRSHSNRL